MNLSAERLVAATGCRPDIAEHVAPFLERSMQKRSILENPARAANFLAQCAHESACFTRTEESLSYSAIGLCKTWPTRFYLSPDDAKGRRDAASFANKPELIADAVYGGRMGNATSGDGWRFRGRGFLQVTGRDAYTAFAWAEPTYPAVTYPELVASTEGAAASAAWKWWSVGLNMAVDNHADVARVTRKINGGLIGLAERQALTSRALAAFVSA